MFDVEQLFTEMLKAAEVVPVPCLPKSSVGSGAQLALFPVSPLFGQRTTVAPPPPVATVIARLRLTVSLCALESVTLMVKEDVPATVGVPLSTPEPLKASPAGKDPADSDQL
jgi:hypothetical protein